MLTLVPARRRLTALSVVTTGACVLALDRFLLAWRAIPAAHTLSRRRAIATFVRTVAAALFPIVLLRCVVPPPDRGKSVLVLPLVWNALMWWIDSTLVQRSPSVQEERLASIRLDPSILSGLSFGLCGLVSKTSTAYSHLFVLAIVGCMLVVSPSHNLKLGCLEEQLFDSIQKAALMWCIGVLVAAVVLTVSAGAGVTCSEARPT